FPFRKKAVAHAARGGRELRQSLRQPWEWRPVFVVAIKSARADAAFLQARAARYLIGKPMEAIRSVRIEFLERSHFADLRRDSNEVAAVKAQVLDRLQSCDGFGQRKDLLPVFGTDTGHGIQFVGAIFADFGDIRFERLPRPGIRVLSLSVK